MASRATNCSPLPRPAAATRVWGARLRATLALVLLGALSACVYRVEVQQGNLLEQTDVDSVQVGMTRSQVRFLLGTPIARHPFRSDRWDYMYYLRPGRSPTATQHWVIVWFEGDTVTRIDNDVRVGKPG